MLEILSIVLDHLSAPDLIQCARVSKLLREMVYDDSRWVQRLRAMHCWNEGDARARAEQAMKRKMRVLHDVNGDDLPQAPQSSVKNGTGHPSIVLSHAPGPTDKRHDQLHAEANSANAAPANHSEGFDVINLSPANFDPPSPAQPLNSNNILEVMNKARSIRGGARGEYGRIHAALWPFYKDAVRSKHPSNAKIFRVYRDPIQQARMLAQLVRFAKSDFTGGRLQREKRLSFMMTAFEDAVSKEYEHGLSLGDVDGRMKKYAHVLVTLNGGQRAIDRFISENAVIKDGGKLGDPMDCISPNNPEQLFLEESHAFFGHLSAAINSQIGVVERVFPPSVEVLMPFFERVTAEVVGPYVSTLFDYLHPRSIEPYVRAVSGTYEQCLQFVHTVRLRKTSLKEAVGRMITEIYAPHVEIYLAEELALFKRRSDTEVNAWERQLSQQDASIELLYMSNVNRQADKRDFLSSFKKVVMAPVNALPNFSKASSAKVGANGESLEPPSSQGSTRSSTPAPSHGTGNVMLSRASSPFSEPPTTELAAKAAIMKSRLEGIRSLFSLEVALNLVHMAKAGIERATVFARVEGQFYSDARNQCEAIFIMLLKTLGTRHVKAGFDQAVDHLSKYNPRATSDREAQQGVRPLVIFLELVNVGDLIQQMLDVFYEQELVAARFIDRTDFLSAAVKEKKRFEQMLDDRVAAGLNKGIEVLMAEVEYICATTQNVEDFNPGATGMVINKLIDVSPTNTAVWVVDLVSAHTKMLVGSTDKNVLDVFNQEVGLRLFTTLCKHLKRQRISVSGSIRLIRYVRTETVSRRSANYPSDMNHYFCFIQTLKNKDLLQYFKALRELAQIYLVSPDDAKELAAIIADNDRFLGIFRAEEVYEFAERRADWYQVKNKVEKAMYGIGCIVM